MTSRPLGQFGVLDEEGRRLVKTAMDESGLSARAQACILPVARAIADLEGAAQIRAVPLSEAISYRSLDRKLWA
jgi:magnesium chelatase family protein